MANDPYLIALNDAIHDRVIEMIVGEPRGAVVDIGCGDGTLTAKLAAIGYQARGLDLVTTDFVPDLPIDKGDADGVLPYPDASFEAVVSTEVIEHVENPWHFVREIHRVLKPGGVAVLSTPNLANVYTRLYFALSGKLYNFGETSYRQIGHITPVFLWNLERMCEGSFDFESVDVNASPVPKVKRVVRLRNRWLGQCIVVKLRRIGGGPAPRRTWHDSRTIRV